MRVTVEYLGHIKHTLGVEQTETVTVRENGLVSDLLTTLAERHGELFKKDVYEPKGSDLKTNYILSVNGFLLNQLKGLDTPLKEGDRVVLMPVVTGG